MILNETYELEEIIVSLTWANKKRSAALLSQFNVTQPQFTALRGIERSEGGISMSALSERCQSVMPTMTGIVSRLAKRGLVTRNRDPQDRRTICVKLTEAGVSLLAEIKAQRRARLNLFVAELTAAERENFIALMGRYLESVEYLIDLDKENNEK